MAEQAERQTTTSGVSEPQAKTKAKRLDVQLPYMASPGTIKNAFDRLRQAATPERVNPDFVNTVLQIKGGTGNTVAPFLKKIGLVGSDGSPTDLYKRFRNQTTGGAAIAAAIKHGYQALGNVNEYFYRLDDKSLMALIVQVTGTEPSSSAARQIFSTLKSLKDYADFGALDKERAASASVVISEPRLQEQEPTSRSGVENGLGLNLAYTINLNLPATSDQAVFNAIFQKLKRASSFT